MYFSIILTNLSFIFLAIGLIYMDRRITKDIDNLYDRLLDLEYKFLFKQKN